MWGQWADSRISLWLRMSDHVGAEQVLHGLQPFQAWFCHGSVEMCDAEFATYRVRRCAGDAACSHGHGMTFLRIQPAYECGLDMIPHRAIRQLHNDESVITRQRPVPICAVEKSRILHDDPFKPPCNSPSSASVCTTKTRKARQVKRLERALGQAKPPAWRANPHFQGG